MMTLPNPVFIWDEGGEAPGVFENLAIPPFYLVSDKEELKSKLKTEPNSVVAFNRVRTPIAMIFKIIQDSAGSDLPPLLIWQGGISTGEMASIHSYRGWVEWIPVGTEPTYVSTKLNWYSSHFHPREDSSRFKLELEREFLKERFQEQQGLTILGRLTSGLAHDFNNVLGGIMGYAEVAARKFGNSNPALMHYLNSIVNFTRRARDLSREVLALTSKNQSQLENIDAHLVLSEVTDLMSHLIDKKYRILGEFRAANSTLLGNPSLLANCVINLILNSRDAMPDGGTVEVFTENYVKVGSANGQATDSSLSIRIKDTGMGMEPEVASKIFHPFYTTKKKGSGLGMISVANAVKKMKGTVSVESEVGKGTTIYLVFPVSAKDEDSQRLRKTAQDEQDKQSGKLLVVDDEEGLLEIFSETLVEGGYQVDIARDGQEALELYGKNHKDYDLVLMDINLPKMSGPECYRRMRALRSNVKVILLSGFSPGSETDQLLNQGLAGFVQKPIEMSYLLKVVADVLGAKQEI